MKQYAILLLLVLWCISVGSTESRGLLLGSPTSCLDSSWISYTSDFSQQSSNNFYEEPHKITAGEHLRSRSSRPVGGDPYDHFREPLHVKAQKLLATTPHDPVTVGLMACQNYTHNNWIPASQSCLNFRSFFLDGGTITMLEECTGDVTHFSSIKGTDAQINLHENFINIVQKVQPLYRKTSTCLEMKPLRSNCKMIVKFADNGVAANKNGDLLLGAALAEWCWEAINCTQVIAQGVSDGLITVVSGAYHHPVQAVGLVVAPNWCWPIILFR